MKSLFSRFRYFLYRLGFVEYKDYGWHYHLLFWQVHEKRLKYQENVYMDCIVELNKTCYQLQLNNQELYRALTQARAANNIDLPDLPTKNDKEYGN